MLQFVTPLMNTFIILCVSSRPSQLQSHSRVISSQMIIRSYPSRVGHTASVIAQIPRQRARIVDWNTCRTPDGLTIATRFSSIF